MSSLNTYHNKEKDLPDLSSELFKRTEIPFDKSKEEVWEELSGKLHGKQSARGSARHLIIRYERIALAATIALLLSVGVFSRLYRVKTVCHVGESLTVELPDGSLAELNESTTLHFYPLWWPLSRKVYQEGEAFFEVKNGRRFTVCTSLGNTEVLGTTFTVFAREKRFIVTCHSGQVRVKDALSEQSVILAMNERADLDSGGEFEITEVKVDRSSPAWENRLLMFRSTPLRQVLDKIEEQYGVQIETPEDLNLVYTGNFRLDQSAEKIISLICRPFNLKYEKGSESEYQIIPSEGN